MSLPRFQQCILDVTAARRGTEFFLLHDRRVAARARGVWGAAWGRLRRSGGREMRQSEADVPVLHAACLWHQTHRLEDAGLRRPPCWGGHRLRILLRL